MKVKAADGPRLSLDLTVLNDIMPLTEPPYLIQSLLDGMKISVTKRELHLLLND